MPVSVDELARIGSGEATKPQAKKPVQQQQVKDQVETVDDLAAIGAGQPLKKKDGITESTTNISAKPSTKENQSTTKIDTSGFETSLAKDASQFTPNGKAADIEFANLPKPKTAQEQLEDKGKQIAAKKESIKKSVEDYNEKFGTELNPDDVLATADNTANFLQKLKVGNITSMKEQVEAQKQKAESEAEHPKNSYDFGIENPADPNTFSNKSVKYAKELHDHVIDKTIDEKIENGLTKEQAVNQIAKRLDPRTYNQVDQSIEDRSKIKATDFLSGGIFSKDSEGEFELLNTQKGAAELAYNQGLKRKADDLITEGALTNNQTLLDNGKSLQAQVQSDDEIYANYPSLFKSKIASEIAQEIAAKTGQAEDTESNDVISKISGSSYLDYANTDAYKKYYNNPATRDAALSVLADGNISESSYLGSFGKSLLHPFKELWLAGKDVTGLRDDMERLSESKKEELFPEETPGLKGYVSKIRGAANTTANLVGYMAIQAATGGFGESLGLGHKAAERFGTTMSFGMTSYDTNLKDANKFLDSDAAQISYATLGSMLNSVGGEFLDLGKISKFKELQTPIMQLAERMTDKNITEKAVAELLGKAKDPYINAMLKYGTNVTKGAATMAYFTFANGVNKMLFDSNGTSDDLIANTGTAFMDGLLGMSILGGFGAHADLQREKNTNYKVNIYQLANNEDVARDAIESSYKSGKYDTPTYNQKIAILNNAVAAKNNLAIIEAGNEIKLDESQKVVYVANRTAEYTIKKQLESPLLTEEQKVKYEQQLERLSAQRSDILKGLPFSKNLEPLNDIYQAQQEYKRAYENFNDGVVDTDAFVIEAKKKLQDAIVDYQKSNEPKIIPEKIMLDGEPADKEKITKIIERGQDEVDKHDIQYEGKDNTIHVQLQDLGATSEGNTTSSPKTREAILKEGVDELYGKLEDKAPPFYLDPMDREGSIKQMESQALTAPAGLKSAIKSEELVVELIARNTTEDINDSIAKWQKEADKTGENVDPQIKIDAQKHIDLLREGLEEKGNIHEASKPEEITRRKEHDDLINLDIKAELESKGKRAWEELNKKVDSFRYEDGERVSKRRVASTEIDFIKKRDKALEKLLNCI